MATSALPVLSDGLVGVRDKDSQIIGKEVKQGQSMAIHVRELTKEEVAELQRLDKASGDVPGPGQRARIVLMSRQGWHVPQIARQLHVHHHTVRKYVHRFNKEGMAALHDRPGRGRAPVYGADERQKVVEIARRAPKELGLNGDYWTLSTLQAYLRKTGVATNIGRETIRRILRTNGVTTRRSAG